MLSDVRAEVQQRERNDRCKIMELKQETKQEELEIIAVDEETGELYVPQNVIDHLTQIETAKKEFKAYEEGVRAELKSAMEKYGITKIDTDTILVNYVAEHERISVDSKLLQSAFPEVYQAVTKCSDVKASVKIKVK